MVELYHQLLAFFGVSAAPATFGEFVPWFVSVLGALFLTVAIFKTVMRVGYQMASIGVRR